ncbi:MAG: hypothetical protein ACJAU0_002252 [Flavobacteriales bacterium]|jgi:hypothetical protein
MILLLEICVSVLFFFLNQRTIPWDSKRLLLIQLLIFGLLTSLLILVLFLSLEMLVFVLLLAFIPSSTLLILSGGKYFMS